MRTRCGAICAIAVWIGSAAAVAGPVTQEACPGARPSAVFASGLGKLENLAFDGAGNLYTSSIEGELRRFTPDGTSTLIATTPRELGGIAFSPDKTLYVGHGVPLGPRGAAGVPLHASDAEVLRFSSLSPASWEVFASGLENANGLAFDGGGNLYVAPGFDEWIHRVAPDGTRERWASVYSANGLYREPGGAILASVTLDQASPIVRLDPADPASREVVASLSFGAVTTQPGAHAPSSSALPLVPKGLDDIGVAPDGTIYATAHVTGEVLRVDPSTGAACLVAWGLHEPSSVRVATAFGTYDGQVFVTEFGGGIVVLPA